MNDQDYLEVEQAFKDTVAYDSARGRWPEPRDEINRAQHIFIAGYDAALRNERRVTVPAFVEWRIEGHTMWFAQQCESRTAAQALAGRLRKAAELLSYAIEIEIQDMQGVGPADKTTEGKTP